MESLDQAEDHLFLAAATYEGRILDEKTATRLLGLPGEVEGAIHELPLHTEILEELTLAAYRQRIPELKTCLDHDASALSRP